MNTPLIITLYIFPIVAMMLVIKFNLHLRFATCNLFTVPAFFTLLPFLVHLYEHADSTTYGFFEKLDWLTAIVGYLYALPMTLITLMIAIVSYDPWTKKRVFMQ